jgi:hypothetical protein
MYRWALGGVRLNWIGRALFDRLAVPKRMYLRILYMYFEWQEWGKAH